MLASTLAYDFLPKCNASGFAPFPQLSQEFVGRHKKRILLEDSTNVDGLLAAFEPILMNGRSTRYSSS